MKSYLNRSIVLAVLLLSQLSVVVNAAAMMPDDSLAEVQSSMPCHDADEAVSLENCCSDNCACPAMGCAASLLTLESGLLKFFFFTTSPKYASERSGDVLHSVNSLLRPPISA